MEISEVAPISDSNPKVASSMQIRVATLFGSALFGSYLARRTAKSLNLPGPAQTALPLGVACLAISLIAVSYFPVPGLVTVVFGQVVPMHGFYKHSLLTEVEKQLAENRVSPMPWRDIFIVIIPLNVVLITAMIIVGL